MKPCETASSTCMRQDVPGRVPHSALTLGSPTNIRDSPTHSEDVVVILRAPVCISVYHSTVTKPQRLVTLIPNNEAPKNASSRWGAPGAPWSIDPELHGPLDGIQHRLGDLAQFMFWTCLAHLYPFVAQMRQRQLVLTTTLSIFRTFQPLGLLLGCSKVAKIVSSSYMISIILELARIYLQLANRWLQHRLANLIRMSKFHETRGLPLVCKLLNSFVSHVFLSVAIGWKSQAKQKEYSTDL